jgi:TonB family protein
MVWGATLGLALVLLFRRTARHAFGAGPAFTLWLLPIALTLAPLLPHELMPEATVVLPGLTVTPYVLTTGTSQVITIDVKHWLVAVWLLGVASGLFRLAWHYFKLLRGLRAPPAAWNCMLAVAEPKLDTRRVRVHDAGPAVLWALPHAWILLPADFAERFECDASRELVIRHELTHIRRGDALWSFAMEVASALLWFHPLAWFAPPRFRLDQELACDAASLRAAPELTVRYARALLHSASAQPAPALIPWLAEPQLKERIAMIARIPPVALRRRTGFVAVAMLLAVGLYLASSHVPANAALGNSTASTPSVNITYKNRNPPKYPVDALRNGEQGMVALRVHVDAAGEVTKVDVDASKSTTSSAELLAAAVTAAEGWKFNPGKRDGKSVGGWITIPVTFSLQPTGPCPAGQAHASKPPFECVPVEPAASS